MSRKSKRASKRHSRRHSRRTHRRTHRRHTYRGGVAPLSDRSMEWASKMSNGQGGDYNKYHVGQHGGALLVGADINAVHSLPSSLRAAALLGGQDNAYSQIAGMKDQAGGRRHRRSKHSRHSKRHHSKHHHSKRRKGHSRKRRNGGAVHFSPYPSQGMLLSPSQAAGAGLSDQWRGVETYAADKRAAM